MEIKITTLSENTAGAFGLLGEWGLSILVEACGLKILLDTGLSISAVHNANKLDMGLNTLDKIVLSHGHHDHTGGLKNILSKIRGNDEPNYHKGHIEVIAHPDVFTAKYAIRENSERLIGIPFSRQELENAGACFQLSTAHTRITDNIITTGEIPMSTSYEQIEPVFYVKKEDSMQPDPLADDQALIINSDTGLIVIAGCAHRGIINTLLHAQKLTGNKKIHTVIGGTHLFNANEEQIWLTIAALKEMGIQKLGVSHCTGMPAAVLLAQEFGDTFFFNNAGTRTTIPLS
jgi:7,8-dihydropterin-6-yl-methyl-4-(beta-D-ribofuranosyl)aminobenzene 5'-phosphate synthase